MVIRAQRMVDLYVPYNLSASIIARGCVKVEVPSPANGIVLLVAYQLVVAQHLLRLVCGQQTTCAHSYMYDAYLVWIALRAIRDVHYGVVSMRHGRL